MNEVYELLDRINEHNIRPMLTKIVKQEETIARLERKIDRLTLLVEELAKRP